MASTTEAPPAPAGAGLDSPVARILQKELGE
jgi:hypothetical protein